MTRSAEAMIRPAGEAAERFEESAPPRDRGGGGMSFRALWALYVLTLRQHLHGKRWVVSAALFLLPAGLAVFLRATSPDVPPRGMEFMFAFMFIPQALLPLVALLYASGIVSDEQEEQTITYLLVRPIPKWAMYVVKLAAAITTTVVLTGLFTGLTYAAIYAGGATSSGEEREAAVRSLKAIGIHALAVAAYCGAFGLISLLTRRVLIVGILYAVIVEGFLANLPMSVRLVTVIYYARMIAYRSMGFVVPTPGLGTHDVAAQLWGLDVRMDPQLLEHPTIRGSVMVLLGVMVGCAVIGAFLCARREFHVKTPGKE